MAERKTTPNIMGELLGGNPEPAAKQDKPPKQRAGISVKQYTGTPAQQPTADLKPIKATYYFSPETIEAIDEAWMKLRRLAGAGRSSVSKSLIVEKAIQMALKELEHKGDKSQIASMTVSQHR
jgi:hypothetical protein